MTDQTNCTYIFFKGVNGGHSTLGYAHVPPNRPYFFLSLSPKDPHFYQLSPNDPLFLTNSLSLKDPDTSSLSLPLVSLLIFADNFRQKIGFFVNFNKFDEMLRNFWPFRPWKPLFFDAFHWKTPIFVRFVTERPIFWRNMSPKDPYIWGTWWHSYVTFICECPPPSPREY